MLCTVTACCLLADLPNYTTEAILTERIRLPNFRFQCTPERPPGSVLHGFERRFAHRYAMQNCRGIDADGAANSGRLNLAAEPDDDGGGDDDDDDDDDEPHPW